MRGKDKLKNIEEANKRLLGENMIPEEHAVNIINQVLKQLTNINNGLHIAIERKDWGLVDKISDGVYDTIETMGSTMKKVGYISKKTPYGESLTNLKNIVKEDHADTDGGKMSYIKSALKNLSSDDLDKVYKMVEELDPEYDSGNSEWSREWMRRGGVHF